MSDLTPQPTPPPPPPPPPSSPTIGNYDVLRPFTFAFDDPRWLTKVLIGGLFALASIFLIGIFFVLGYCARLARNVIEGAAVPLPEWDDLAEYFGEGVRLFFIGLLYTIPMMVLVCFFIVPMAISGNMENEALQQVMAGIGLMFWCLMMPLSLALMVWLPGALLMAVVSKDFGAAFDFARIARFIRANVANYVIAILVMIVARFAAGFGIILCFIGVIFTGFWSGLVSVYAFAQVYRLSSEK